MGLRSSFSHRTPHTAQTKPPITKGGVIFFCLLYFYPTNSPCDLASLYPQIHEPRPCETHISLLFDVENSSRRKRKKRRQKYNRPLELLERLCSLAGAGEYTDDVEADLATRWLAHSAQSREGGAQTVLDRGLHWPTVTWSPSSTRNAGETWAARFLWRFS